MTFSLADLFSDSFWRPIIARVQKFYPSARNYEWNLERTSNSSQSTRPCRTSALGRITRGSHITYYSLVFFIAYAFKGQVHVLINRTCENCKSLVLQDKCNIEIFLSPDSHSHPSIMRKFCTRFMFADILGSRTKHPGTKHPMPFFYTPDKTSHKDLPPRTKHPTLFLSPRT